MKTPCIDLHIPMLMAKGPQSIQGIKNECSGPMSRFSTS